MVAVLGFDWVARTWRAASGAITGYRRLLQENASLTRRVHQLEEENLQLKRDLSTIKAQVEAEQQFQYRAGVYWIDDPSVSDRGPFCPNCWNQRKVKVHPRRWNTGHYCDVCKAHIPDPEAPAKEPGPSRYRRGKGFVQDW